MGRASVDAVRAVPPPRCSRLKRRPLPGILLLVSVLACGCSGRKADVRVISLQDGSVVGEVTPSSFGQYRDMVIGIDDAGGRIAIMEWGQSRSTLRIVTLRPWQVSEHSIAAGRVGPGGIGSMSFDFPNERLLFSTDPATDDGKQRMVAICLRGDKLRKEYQTVPKGYDTGDMISTPEGIFFEADETRSDYMGFRLHRIAPDADSSQEIYRSGGRLWGLGVSGRDLCFLEDANNYGTNVRVVRIDRVSLAKTESALSWPLYNVDLQADHVFLASPNENMIRRVSFAAPHETKTLGFPVPENGLFAYSFAGTQDHVLLMLQTPLDPKLFIGDFSTRQVRELRIPGFQGRPRAFRYGGEDYAVLSD